MIDRFGSFTVVQSRSRHPSKRQSLSSANLPIENTLGSEVNPGIPLVSRQSQQRNLAI